MAVHVPVSPTVQYCEEMTIHDPLTPTVVNVPFIEMVTAPHLLWVKEAELDSDEPNTLPVIWPEIASPW